MGQKYKKLRRAVQNWIKAEFQFRFGPQCYQTPTDQWIVKAERKLRKALTGKSDLVEAAQKINPKLKVAERKRKKKR